MNKRSIRADPIRRHYNQWVSNEMLEDYALRFTALKRRRWSCLRVANTALGSISFLALEAIGAATALQYGLVNALYAIAAVSIIIFLLGVPVAFHSAKAGVDIDLLTRGAGFGYLGSTFTSLIYAGFTFIFFALEAAILAAALEVCFSIPLSIGYLLSSLVVIPIVVYGITMISKLQRFTQHIWLVLQLAPFAFLIWQSVDPMEGWQGLGMGERGTEQPFDWLMFGAASAVIFSLTVQIGEQVDYLRFLPVKTKANSRQWWLALIAAGPGWIIIGALKMLAGVYLCILALNQGLISSEAVDPVHLYLNAWDNWLTPDLALAITGIFVIICQFKINITNSYAGSIAWSNFFSRLTHSHPGRVVWLVFNVTIAWMLMELGVYDSLENTLSLYSILGVSWIAAIAADLAINKPLGLSPKGIRFKRAELHDINPVGVGAMAVSTGIGFIAYSGVWGPLLQSLATYLTLVCVIILVPALALITRGRYYLSDAAHQMPVHDYTCTVCRNDYDSQDLIHCPAYQGSICSLCCSLDSHCKDQCRPEAPFLTQLRQWTKGMLAQSNATPSQWLVLQFLYLLCAAAVCIAFIFGLVYLLLGEVHSNSSAELTTVLQNLFAALLVLAAIVTWIFLLTSESARRAREDTAHQNELLQKEITAHETTAEALRTARKKADAANEAKSRYVVGLSHELRTPLNSILGYAQLMEHDKHIPQHRQNGVRVIRDSARHLSGLIESLLDISRIEAGRLSIHRDKVNLHGFLDQLIQMFRIQAEAARLDFRVSISPHVPKGVFADEKRLRQILINLLSNAFKYTSAGYVELLVDYRSQITTFRVSDSGPGIAASDLNRIFEPFETLPNPHARATKGTGLGLTISKLLAGIMGGGIEVSSTPGQGSCFMLKLLLPPMQHAPGITAIQQSFEAQLKNKKTIAVVDDEENHRVLIADFLEPMGFTVHHYPNARVCIDALDSIEPDVFILDICMPDINGWELAAIIRDRCKAPVRILMISALVEEHVQMHAHDASSHNYFAKPIDLRKLLARLEEILKIDFQDHDTTDLHNSQEASQLHLKSQANGTIERSDPHALIRNDSNKITVPTAKQEAPVFNSVLQIHPALLIELKQLYTIGHLRAIKETLNRAATDYESLQPFILNAQQLLEHHQLEAFGALLESASARQHD